MNALSNTYEYLFGPFDRIKSKQNNKKECKEENSVRDSNVAEKAGTDSNVINQEKKEARGVSHSTVDRSETETEQDHVEGTPTKANLVNVSSAAKEESKHETFSSISADMSRGLKFFIVVWSIITFFPNYLLIKPIIFIWFVVTFPLSLIEHNVRRRVTKNNDTNKGEIPLKAEKTETGSVAGLNAIEESIEDDLSSGEIMELQKDTVKGSLLTAKQSTPSKIRNGKLGSNTSNMSNTLGTKSMGRFQFPKKLIPKSILNSNKKKTLVIDLDETLIHSISRGTTHSNSSQAHIIEVRFAISGVSTLYYVHKRPYCDLFLSKVCKWYNLIIFTASMKEYADPVINWLENSFSGRFAQRMYRNNCIMRDGVGYIKDLANIKDPDSKELNVALTDIIIIDNSPISYAMHVDNAIQVEGWISDPTDTELLNLLPFLEALRHTTDVRNILSLKNAEKAFHLN